MSWRLVFSLTVYLVVTYFVCGIPFGKYVAKWRADVDIEKVGSGNIGTTNVARTVGAGAAGLTLLADAGKGFLATSLYRPILAAVALDGDASSLVLTGNYGWIGALVLLCALVGHVFSPYLSFKGGKGVATGFGSLLGLAWPVGLGLAVVWLVVMVPVRIVSAASCIGALSFPFLAWAFLRPSWSCLALMCCSSALVIWAHRSNIRKLFAGEEKRFEFHKNTGDASSADSIPKAVASVGSASEEGVPKVNASVGSASVQSTSTVHSDIPHFEGGSQ